MNKKQMKKQPKGKNSVSLDEQTKEIIDGVAANHFDGNFSMALRWIVKTWNTSNTKPAQAA